MFSSYPTTTVLPTRRAQTPPISSLPTSPSDEVGRRQSLTSPDSQSARPANRTGACADMHYDIQELTFQMCGTSLCGHFVLSSQKVK